jgi:ankyrin repeat protein
VLCRPEKERTRNGRDLVAAVKKRSFQKALELIAEGVDINARGARGETALLWAVIHGDEPLVSAVLRPARRLRPALRARGRLAMVPLRLRRFTLRPSKTESISSRCFWRRDPRWTPRMQWA